MTLDTFTSFQLLLVFGLYASYVGPSGDFLVLSVDGRSVFKFIPVLVLEIQVVTKFYQSHRYSIVHHQIQYCIGVQVLILRLVRQCCSKMKPTVEPLVNSNGYRHFFGMIKEIH
jgi:hypothetical protein